MSQLITAVQLLAIAGSGANESNVASIVEATNRFGASMGLDRPHRLAQYLAQIAHESGRFRHDREVWGPTPAQRRYEGRKDLGNTQPGDGSKFRGHTPIQITGRANTTAFRDWCQAKFPGLKVPDFVATPTLMNTDPWEGLGPLWYWDTRNLNRYADTGNIEAITRKINGGLNGYADRCELYARAALVLLGYEMKAGAVRRFQVDAGFTGDDVDDIAGAKTRAAMHEALKRRPVVVEAPAPAPTPAPKPAKGMDRKVIGGLIGAIAAAVSALAAYFMNGG